MAKSLFLGRAKRTRAKTTEITERDIENQFCIYAKQKGCYPLKLILQALRGFPDRTVLCPRGRVLFIEFKRKGGMLTNSQAKWRDTLRALGFTYLVCDEPGDAERRLDEFLSE